VNVCRNESAGLVGIEINEFDKCLKTLERVKGIEPSYSAWKAAIRTAALINPHH